MYIHNGGLDKGRRDRRAERLWESVSKEWAGDVDLNDGKLQPAYEQHQDRIKWVKSIGLQSQGTERIKQDLMKAQEIVSTEIDFVSNGMGIFIV